MLLADCPGEDDAAEWVVPVFLFDVSHTDLLLIDRTHQVRPPPLFLVL
jgi:hypothetical protein